MVYVMFDEPVPLLGFAPTLLPLAEAFTNVVGHSLFGDLFLRASESGEYAVLIACTLELLDTGVVEEREFREQFLADPAIVRELLRPEDAAAITCRVGIGRSEALIPVPIPAIGGSGPSRPTSGAA